MYYILFNIFTPPPSPLSHRYTDEEYEQFADLLLAKQPHRPTIGIILGSGLSNLVSKLEEKYEVPYDKIPNFPVSTGKLN